MTTAIKTRLASLDFERLNGILVVVSVLACTVACMAGLGGAL